MIAQLVGRHIKLFFRDKGAVFFSLLSPLILFALYFFFLGNVQLESLAESVPNVEESTLQAFLYSWVYAGIVMIAAVTTGLAALNIFVRDRASGQFTDFAVSPVSRWKIIVSYLLSTAVIAIGMTTVVYVLGQVHLLALGADAPSLTTILDTVWRYSLVALSFAALSSLAVTFLKSEGAFTSVSIIVGTALGFVAGVYAPIGALSTSVANILNALPFAQGAVLLREPFVADSLAKLSESQPQQLIDGLSDTYGLQAVVGDHAFTTLQLSAILASIAIVAVVLATLRISQKLR